MASSTCKIRLAFLAMALAAVAAVLLAISFPAITLAKEPHIPDIPAGAGMEDAIMIASRLSYPLSLSKEELREAGLTGADWQELDGQRVDQRQVEGLLQGLTGRMGSAAYGQSVENMIGVFSIEKKVILGDNPADEAARNAATDPLSLASGAGQAARMGPRLLDFEFLPWSVNSTAGPQQVNFTLMTDEPLLSPTALDLADDELEYAELANAQQGEVSRARFVSPSGGKSAEMLFFPRGNGTIYSGNLTLPQDSEAGVWMLHSLTLVGASGYRVQMDADEVQATGCPAAFRVERG
ncbi:MAG: hypothetical protein GKC10_01610 [Methanosarcinales archaeon]|nr:hypothetical protein [Methanosarcinales archaeon]